MSNVMNARDHGRPRRTRVKRPRTKVSGGGGSKKGGLCPFYIPAAAASLLALAAQFVFVKWQTWGAK